MIRAMILLSGATVIRSAAISGSLAESPGWIRRWYDGILERLKRKHFDLSRLRVTLQPIHRSEKKRERAKGLSRNNRPTLLLAPRLAGKARAPSIPDSM